MPIDIKAPQFPESVADGSIATWHKKPGETCKRDDLLVDIETDKVVLEVTAPADGVIKEILHDEGATVESEMVIATFEEGAAGDGGDSGADDKKESDKSQKQDKQEKKEDSSAAAAEKSAADKSSDKADDGPRLSAEEADKLLSPAARRMVDEYSLDATRIKGTGKGGRITKEDVMAYQSAQHAPDRPKDEGPRHSAPGMNIQFSGAAPVGDGGERTEKRVPMTRLRKTIAKRLVEAQQNAAMLTTYNEVNMKPVMELRSRYKELFEKTHNGARLGFMSFFVKAATEALKRFPDVNASIDGDDVVYHGYYDVGVAVSSDRGLVVPVLRDADSMGLAEIETQIRDFGARAQKGQVSIDEMQGGTFTISNGGVFGSLMSTPILNPPQTAIMGMHKIQERPMAVNGQVEILPMMYLALSYDHRMIDGKEAVQFLVTIKELLEDPARILLDV
ncbi:2-oxoglutarate dehydrogenase complex dihydrolipoyllysine-residue succinyltransferase [Natronospirillum operosum]|uniref:Dihydrolipoyllysine-residue succinyltransferase component of 2-oxoglutarate dehydrogenase complex n=1 Tax=Natronospirillum operosum TaxID=2759953 RepID=A0A4Z0WGM5_9GAMM|nr:2-oxoglutarate dehydrogenase complex dihydrolipoyllysine-residue succinyltransferase [Natronospirillum operosum]TGG95698.1 2-oxoglutarate dehydrogenase complex dihydrolipoyllysine-residue succinyltransferase [Natronospirillum operosum]